MEKENLKERIQNCLLALDFDTDRMSTVEIKLIES